MTVMTPMEGITAPIRPASDPATDPAAEHPAPPTRTFTPHDDESPLVPSRRADGWSAANQRIFLERIAAGFGVDVACASVSLSVASAYAFRRTAKGAAFALGWRGAVLLARECVAETLLVRALEGQVDTVVRSNGSSFTRHRHDNRLAMSLLARLDRQVEHAPDADVQAARLVAQDFDAFLGLVERDDGPARAGLFITRAAATAAALSPGSSPAPSDATGCAPVASPAVAALLSPIQALATADRLVRTGTTSIDDIPVADLDPAARAHWTAEQWARAEAAGLLAFTAAPVVTPAPEDCDLQENALSPQHIQYSPIEDEGDRHIWWDETAEDWRTDFPPPEGFDGDESGKPTDDEYDRALTAAERALMGPTPAEDRAAEVADLADIRDAFFTHLSAMRTTDAAPMNPWPPSSVDAAHAMEEPHDDREEG